MADLPGTVEEMAERYLRLLRTVRPSGLYHLVGWSFGGLVAHAMAVRLRELGEPEGTLFLVDAVAATGAGPAEPIDERHVHRMLLTAAGCDGGSLTPQTLDFATVSALLRREGSLFARLTEDDIARVVAVSRHNDPPPACAPTAPRATRAPPPTSRPPASRGARCPRTSCGGRTPAAS
ncbi:hypothetical protein SANTM175S_04381 [Streptomyces antimycoticus]